MSDQMTPERGGAFAQVHVVSYDVVMVGGKSGVAAVSAEKGRTMVAMALYYGTAELWSGDVESVGGQVDGGLGW